MKCSMWEVDLDPVLDLGLDGDQSVEYGVRHVQEMARIIQRLITDGKSNFTSLSDGNFTSL